MEKHIERPCIESLSFQLVVSGRLRKMQVASFIPMCHHVKMLGSMAYRKLLKSEIYEISETVNKIVCVGAFFSSEDKQLLFNSQEE